MRDAAEPLYSHRFLSTFLILAPEGFFCVGPTPVLRTRRALLRICDGTQGFTWSTQPAVPQHTKNTDEEVKAELLILHQPREGMSHLQVIYVLLFNTNMRQG